jgi:hypothetical protein
MTATAPAVHSISFQHQKNWGTYTSHCSCGYVSRPEQSRPEARRRHLEHVAYEVGFARGSRGESQPYGTYADILTPPTIAAAPTKLSRTDRILTRFVGPLLLTVTAAGLLTAGLVSAY